MYVAFVKQKQNLCNSRPTAELDRLAYFLTCAHICSGDIKFKPTITDVAFLINAL